MILSDHIARLIEEMLEEGGGSAEVRRNDLAAQIGCVPSQINYVITSRFTPEHGYVTESRRGGGGYIRIFRFIPAEKRIACYTIDPGHGGAVVHDCWCWHDDALFNFELPYPASVEAR